MESYVVLGPFWLVTKGSLNFPARKNFLRCIGSMHTTLECSFATSPSLVFSYLGLTKFQVWTAVGKASATLLTNMGQQKPIKQRRILCVILRLSARLKAS
eukprot:5227579-Amphidinium_carterae.1